MKQLCIIYLLIGGQFIFSQTKSINVEESPFVALEYLIGTWELDFGRGKSKMIFEWGTNKTYVTCRGENIIDGKIQPEFFSLIIYDGLLEAFGITSSYTDPGSLLIEKGIMTISNKSDEILREFELHYAENEIVPFTKKKVSKGGFKMRWRQKWTKIDETTFTGIMEINLGEKWEMPFGRSPDKLEIWNKID